MKLELKLTLSFLLGIAGIILLIFNLVVVMFFPIKESTILGERISGKIINIFGSIADFFFIIVVPFSFFGIFLGIKFLPKRFAIGTVILNVFNLIFSLLIAWLLFGLARGM